MEKLTHIVTRKTPYYITGPQEGRDAEGSLKKGTLVLILQPSDSYPRVQTEDGSITGYVFSGDIAPIQSVEK